MPYIEPKYLFPHYGEMLLTTSEALFGYDRVRELPATSVVITEGVFDAITVNRKLGNSSLAAVAILSNKMSDGQLLKLLQLPKSTTKFYVMLDADAYKFGLHVLKRLQAYKRNAYMCFLESKDPDVATTEELSETIKAACVVDMATEMSTILEG